MNRHSKRRIPTLAFTKKQNIGWHVNYRDPQTGVPRRHRFGLVERDQASELYNTWLVEHLRGAPHRGGASAKVPVVKDSPGSLVQMQPGSLLHVGSNYLFYEEKRTRKPGEPRRAGTICPALLAVHKYDVADFLKFINRRYGPGSAGRLSVLDLKMVDVEAYNAELVDAGHSNQLVSKRLLTVKAVIDRAGRPEHGEQVLSWNWNARDKLLGKAGTPRTLPTLPQLKGILTHCDARHRAIVWMGLGLGFGQGDLAAVRVGQIDAKTYDLRRGKTGLERYGETPPGAWKAISEYLKEQPRELGDLLFVSGKGKPLSHGNTDSIHLWWRRLRTSMGKLGDTLGGFYVLRHLGATEFGSRPGCSIGGMRRWLGHAASSAVADIYMRPVAPEHRPVVEWVRKQLRSK
ncbi:MAG TPA: site-specific integrase [Tepidisphaeraceae bacterium]|jgi:integrase|nr:site-specific integrase [Tepidisphaeraceae bacterium]